MGATRAKTRTAAARRCFSVTSGLCHLEAGLAGLEALSRRLQAFIVRCGIGASLEIIPGVGLVLWGC
jgi:hypothetical protein